MGSSEVVMKARKFSALHHHTKTKQQTAFTYRSVASGRQQLSRVHKPPDSQAVRVCVCVGGGADWRKRCHLLSLPSCWTPTHLPTQGESEDRPPLNGWFLHFFDVPVVIDAVYVAYEHVVELFNFSFELRLLRARATIAIDLASLNVGLKLGKPSLARPSSSPSGTGGR